MARVEMFRKNFINSRRVILRLKMLRMIDQIAMMATGEGKSAALGNYSTRLSKIRLGIFINRVFARVAAVVPRRRRLKAMTSTFFEKAARKNRKKHDIRKPVIELFALRYYKRIYFSDTNIRKACLRAFCFFYSIAVCQVQNCFLNRSHSHTNKRKIT
jgi:hypothetical protein